MNVSGNPMLQEGKRLFSRFAFEDAPVESFGTIEHHNFTTRYEGST